MKSKLLFLATSTLLYANAKTTSRLLGSEDLAGETKLDDPTHYGDTKHVAANSNTLAATTEIIHQQLVDGLHEEFGFIQNSIRGDADTEGFVRDGIIFCGHTENTDAKLTTVPQKFSLQTKILVPDDGYGGSQNDQPDESELCKANACEEGSFVSTIANRIRSIGYHVTHSDICAAESDSAWNVNPLMTCQLNGYKGFDNSTTDDLTSKSYEADAGSGTNDWLEQRNLCYTLTKSSCVTDCEWNSFEYCAPSGAWISSENLGNPTYTIQRDNTAANGAIAANEIRRETAYQGFEGQSVTDRVYVTGVKAAFADGSTTPENDCTSLRQYVAALNGLQQINDFRDLGILEGENVWNELIEEMRKNFKGIAHLLNDYYDESIKLFPLIEFEEVETCPIGVTERDPARDIGTEQAPLCTKQKFMGNKELNAIGVVAQGILRSECFCRQLTSTSDELASEDIHYLEYDLTKLKNTCTALKNSGNNKDVREYVCEINAAVNEWKEVLQELEPVAHKIKVFSGNQTEIYDNIKDTMSLVDDGMTPDCGRLISTDNTFDTSNKGANCLPFAKINQVLFKLELGTSSFKNAETFLLGEVGVVDSVMALDDYSVLKNDTNVGKVMTAFEAFESSVTDPQVHEAAFNVKIAKGLKRAVSDANEVTWLALRDELTSLDKNRIAYSIAEDAARHFMRITTTDDDDKAVDNIDADALNPDTELPTTLRTCPLEIDVSQAFTLSWSKDSAEAYAFAGYNAANALVIAVAGAQTTTPGAIITAWLNGTDQEILTATIVQTVNDLVTAGATATQASYTLFCSGPTVDCSDTSDKGVVLSYNDPENYEVVQSPNTQTVEIVYTPTDHVLATGDYDDGIESVTPVNDLGVTVELFDVVRCDTTTHRPLTQANFNNAITKCLAEDDINGNCPGENYGSISGWDTSRVTDMYQGFYLENSFNGDIGNWDTSQVTNMREMFHQASAFNQDIGSWNTDQVTNMYGMFQAASLFNLDISSWNTGLVTDMMSMFYMASAFNQDIGSWNTERVTNMAYLFNDASAFNQDIGSWNTQQVASMVKMFGLASAFNQDIGGWNTGQVAEMHYMFQDASLFNQYIGGWNTGQASNMNHMFVDATAFNQDIGSWDTGVVQKMQGMFYGATAFNQDIGSWNTGLVTDMTSMFKEAIAFNQDISSWTGTAATTAQTDMFKDATAFQANFPACTDAITGPANSCGSAPPPPTPPPSPPPSPPSPPPSPPPANFNGGGIF